jgi:hypothetical protein
MVQDCFTEITGDTITSRAFIAIARSSGTASAMQRLMPLKASSIPTS